jgi:hypothetical protein
MLCFAVQEMSWCFADARDDPQTGVIILTGGWMKHTGSLFVKPEVVGSLVPHGSGTQVKDWQWSPVLHMWHRRWA